MVINEKSPLYFEHIGFKFSEWASPYDARQRVKLIKKMMPPNAMQTSCLEVGCGTGMITGSLLPLVRKLSVVDISTKLAQAVGSRFGIDWKAMDACDLQFPNDSFDLVVSSECIEHTSNPKKALQEMARVLKSGGTLIVTSPNKLWFPVLWISERLRLRSFAGNETWLFPWKAGHILRQSGLIDLRYGGCHLFPWQIPGAQAVLPFFDVLQGLIFPLMINYAVSGEKR
jgi:SAM-dependent methyltransferase